MLGPGRYCFVKLVRLINTGNCHFKTVIPKMVTQRIVPITRKIATPEFQQLLTPELIKLYQLFEKNHFQLRMAGGAVRDLLMGIKPCDIDFATNATPEEMKELFTKEQIRMLNKNGEEHGTVTCRIDDKQNFEVTTLRVDLVCDGRRAKVEFTTDWQLDANRRDLTVNSLFLDFDGTVFDYFGGIKDVEKRRILFVGSPTDRIQEDYLRILRYFRFFGRLALSPDGHDEKTLNAIKDNRNGLNNISGERIWSELKKICIGRMGGDMITTMLNTCDLGPLLAIPNDANTSHFLQLHKRYYSSSIEAMTLLTSLFQSQNDLETFHKRCKLSYADKSLAEFIQRNREGASRNVDNVTYFKNVLLDEERLHKLTRKKVMTSREKVLELMKYVYADDSLRVELSSWRTPVFPIGGADLMHSGIPSGPSLRVVLDHLFEVWKKSMWSMGKNELLSHVNEVNLDENNRKRRFQDSIDE